MQTFEIQDQENKNRACKEQKSNNFMNKAFVCKHFGFYCRSIELGQNNMLFISNREKIQILRMFNNCKVLQVINAKINNNNNFFRPAKIFCLKYIDKQEILISCDVRITLWKLINKQYFSLLQILEKNQIKINSLQVNKKFNLMIVSGSRYGLIKFWRKNQDWECIQTIEFVGFKVYSTSLNKVGQKLIAIINDYSIRVFQQEQDKKWYQHQNITINIGYRVSFITNDIFVVSTRGEYLYTYELDQQSQSFKITQLSQIEATYQCNHSSFPIQFNEEKRILLVKQSCFVNLMSRNQNGIFKTIQTFNFKTQNVYGTFSHNCKYLITWDWSSKQIQMRYLLLNF